jgi:homocysteine S-methyltransferase
VFGATCTPPPTLPPPTPPAAVARKPIVVYPNSGERWDAASRRWTGSPGIWTDDVPAWVAAGARLVGGCCRVRPADIETLAVTLRNCRHD